MLKRLLPAVFSVLLVSCMSLSHEIQGGLNEQEAQEIIVLLKENGVDAVREREAGKKDGPQTWAVKVKGGDHNVVVAWKVLRENGLPRDKVKGLEEVFSQSGMIPTASEEKARLLLALSGELSRTLKLVTGVVDARVHVVLPENSPLLEKSQWNPTTAAVLLKYVGQQPPLKDEEIKSLVAKGIEGLQMDNVAVVFKRVDGSRAAPRDVAWYLGNQQIVVLALGFSVFTAAGCLGLAVRGRQQRVKLEALRKQLSASPLPPRTTSRIEGASA